jgi:endonuclease/exonuclease/phosphatase (EEP) superfamily protein YafD
VLGLLDRWSTYLEFATLYRLHYAVLLGLAALVAIPLRAFPVALVALLLAGINVLVTSRVPPGPETEAAGPARLRALIINVRDKNDEYDQLRHLVAETDPDVVGLIELTPAWARALQTRLTHYPVRQLQPEEGATGVGLYSRRRLADSRILHVSPDRQPSLVANVALGERSLVLVIVHVRTIADGADRERQLRALSEELEPLGDRVAVCGDFNSVPWSDSIRDFADGADLQSIFGRFGRAGTWPTYAGPLRIPIDNCLVGEGVAVTDRRIGPDIGSDHLPLIVDFGPAEGR